MPNKPNRFPLACHYRGSMHPLGAAADDAREADAKLII